MSSESLSRRRGMVDEYEQVRQPRRLPAYVISTLFLPPHARTRAGGFGKGAHACWQTQLGACALGTRAARAVPCVRTHAHAADASPLTVAPRRLLGFLPTSAVLRPLSCLCLLLTRTPATVRNVQRTRTIVAQVNGGYDGGYGPDGEGGPTAPLELPQPELGNLGEIAKVGLRRAELRALMLQGFCNRLACSF